MILDSSICKIGSGGSSGYRSSHSSNSDGDSASYTYDSSGRLISEQGVDSDGNYSISYDYNLGQRSSKKHSDGTETFYYYGSDGKLTKVTEFSESGETTSITFEYNSLGQRIKKIEGDGDTVTDYDYNNNGQLIQSVETNSNGDFIMNYSYNSSGQFSEFRWTYTSSSVDCSPIYSNAGQLSENKCVDSDQKVHSSFNYNYESATCTAFFDLIGINKLLFGTSVCKP